MSHDVTHTQPFVPTGTFATFFLFLLPYFSLRLSRFIYHSCISLWLHYQQQVPLQYWNICPRAHGV